nr:hypothetical protein [Candidatus Njordarchaeota archaeon]
MQKKAKIIAGTVVIFVIVGAGLGWTLLSRRPSTLPLGQTPVIGLPVYDFSHNNIIGGYGNIRWGGSNTTVFHNGIDFGFNATVTLVSPYNTYVDEIKCWYNEKGGHWQTNVVLWINQQWTIEMIFESWALNETYGRMQLAAISVVSGQYVPANQTIGDLLFHGSGCHLHFGVKSYGETICPYDVFSESAKLTFAAQFFKVNATAGWNM